MGNHFKYDLRYPKNFTKFTANDLHNKMNPGQKENFAQYLNSILYNDYVVSEIYQIFKDDEALIVYLSDHGETLFEIDGIRGHGMINRFVLEIPLIFIGTDKFKAKYPEMQLHKSVITTAFQKNRDELFYEEISSCNSYYVVHPDDNFNLDLLKKIPKSNAEIIINERCFYRCNQRSEHYISISSDQRKQNNNEKKYSVFLSGCNAMPEIKQGASKQNNISLSIDEIKSIVELGFTSLKIQGRSDSLYSFFFDFLRYTLEPNVAFPNMYNIFVQYIENYLKGV